MAARHLLHGLGSARRHWRLVVMLWLLHLAVALVVMVPVWQWLRRALAVSTEAGRVTGGIDFTVLVDLLENNPGVLPVVIATALVVGMLTALGSVLVSGGLFEVLVSERRQRFLDMAAGSSLPSVARAPVASLAAEEAVPQPSSVPASHQPAAAAETAYARDTWAEPPSAGESDLSPGGAAVATEIEVGPAETGIPPGASEPPADTRRESMPVNAPVVVACAEEWLHVEGRAVLTRFLAGAGRFFWRNLRVTILTAAVAGLAIGVTVSLLRALVQPLEPTNSELGDLFVMLLPLVGGALVLLLFLLILDFARVGLVATDNRRVLGAWWGSVRLLFRHAWRLAAVWLAAAVLVAVGFAVYVVLASPLNGTSWLLIGLLVVLQQLFVLWRATVRVALASAQVDQAVGLGFPRIQRL